MARARDEVPAEDEDQEMDEELVSLQFDEPLSWRAAKPIATGELLRRLEKLSKELVDMDQETVHKESLTKVAKELAAHNLLAHKEGGVKAYTASCLVDILKLCAPDAPFTPTQLKDIFSLLVKGILPELWDPTNAYNTQHKYVLISLAEVKSILLVNELPNSEDLLLHLFSSFFDGISGSSKSTSGEQVAKDVEFHMTEILVTLIDEGPNLPPSVLDVIMAQFLRAAPPGGARKKPDLNGNQTTLLPKEEPAAYVMAKTVCNTCPEKMARYVSQYFSDVIMDITGKGGQANGHRDEDDEDDEDNGPSESDFKELRKAHQLLRELWRAAPTVLQNVVPQVDAELSADNIQLRLLATETLGDMISGIGAAGPPPPPTLDPAAYPPLKLSDESSGNVESSILTTPISPLSFAQTHPQAFHNFVRRRKDRSPLIRAAWTTAIGHIVSTSAGGIGLSREDELTLVNGLRNTLKDNDEKVRLAAVKVIEAFSFRDIVTKLAAAGGVDKEDSVLFTLADRCRDKRPSVRVEAMALLGRLWAVGTGELVSGQESVMSALSGIPTRIFNTFYANDLELNVLLERVAFECLVPLSYPPSKTKGTKANGNPQTQTADASYDPDRIRAERILLLVKNLDDKARKAFFALQTRQPQFSMVLDNFVKQCEAYNGGVPEKNGDITKQNLKKTIQYICQFFPDAVKTETDLYQFAMLNERRCYNLIKFVVDKESTFITMYRAIKEMNKRLQESTKPHILETLVPVLYRSAYIMFNKSHLSTFIDSSKNDRDNLGAAAQQITTEISQHIPGLFKTHIGQICKDLQEAAPTERTENDPGLVETLRACSSYSRKYPEHIPQDKKFTQALMSYALYGQPPKAAKYAVNVMMARKDHKSDIHATDVLQRVMKDWGHDSPHFLNKLAAVSQLELLASKVTSHASDEITDMAVKNVLQKVRTDAKTSDPEWVDDADLDEECQLKCWALKLMVNRLRGIQDVNEAKELAPGIFKLLRSLRSIDGDLCKTRDTPKHHKARLRLLAGQLTLKLCTIKHFEELFTHSDFDKLAILTQDSCAKVRHRFIEKLQKYLVNNKLRPRFYTIIFLTAFEPVSDFKQQIETWIRSRVRYFGEKNQSVMEAVMGRLISLLAHHPDYSRSVEDLLDHAQYLIYYMNNVATESNFGRIFKYAERVKQTRDGVHPNESENLYVLSDLAQTILRKWQERKNWSFQAYSGKFGLPIGLYTVLPSHDAAQGIAEKQYLPEDLDELLDNRIRSMDKKKKRKSMDERAEVHAQKRPKTAQPKAAPKSKEPKAAKPASARKPAIKKLPARPKKAGASPTFDTADRRRSGRSKVNSSYVERNSDDDDDDMFDGVAAWDYYDEDGNLIQNDDDEDDESEATDEAGNEAEPMDEDPKEGEEPDLQKEEHAESEVSEPEGKDENEKLPAPKPTNGRKGRSTAAAAASKIKSTPRSVLKVQDESELSEPEDHAEEETSPARRRGRSAAAPAASKRKRNPRSATAKAQEESELSEPEDEKAEEAEEAEETPQIKRRGRNANATPAASKTKTTTSRPAVKATATKGKAAASKAKPKVTSTRATRGRKTADASDINEDSD